MKKYLFAIVLFLVCHLGYAQNVNTIFNEFKNEANAEYVTISPFLMLIGKVFVHGEGSEIVTKIKSIKVLDLEDCHSQIKERFNKRMSSFDTDRYETLIRVNDSGEKVHRKAIKSFFENISIYKKELESLLTLNFRLTNSQSISF